MLCELPEVFPASRPLAAEQSQPIKFRRQAQSTTSSSFAPPSSAKRQQQQEEEDERELVIAAATTHTNRIDTSISLILTAASTSHSRATAKNGQTDTCQKSRVGKTKS